VLNKNGEWVCPECGVVAMPYYEWPRRKLAKKETIVAILRGYA
jgi:hypothetical protein